MADKMHTLLLGGEEIQVPAWASEATMGQVASYMAQTAKTDAMFHKVMKKVGGDLGELQAEISGLAKATSVDIKADDKSDTEQEKFTKKVIRASSKLDKAMGFFNNHEKPLTAMTDGVSQLAKSAKASGGGFKILEGLTNSTNAAMAGVGTTLNVAADAFLAYAGWNAAKLEQFASIQAKMIDSGILFNGGAAAYDELRKGIQATGNTYLHLSNTLGTFSDGMLGLGDTVSSGSTQFVRYYKQLDKTAESFGDLGMSSKDMLTAYGEFIAFQRRTGQFHKSLNQGAEEMNKTFIDMQIEAGAVANLTSLTRQEAMRASMEALDDYGSAAQRQLIKNGFPEAAEVQKEIAQGIKLMSEKSPSLQGLLDAYNLAAFKAVDDPTNFDMSAVLENLSPGLEAQLLTMNVKIVEDIEAMTKSGVAPAEGFLSYIVNALSNYDDTKMAAAGNASDKFSSALITLAAEFDKVDRDLGNLADSQAIEDEIVTAQKDLTESGKTVVAMNEMGEKFIAVQEALTVDMETTAGLFDTLTASLQNGKKQLDKLIALAGFGDELNDFGGAGGDNERVAESLSGIVPNTEAVQRPTANPDAERGTDTDVEVDRASDAGAIITAMRENEGMLTLEMLESAGLEYVKNLEGAVAYINTVDAGFAEKLIVALDTYDKKMDAVVEAGGPAQYINMTGGRTERVENEDGTLQDETAQTAGVIAQFVITDTDGKLAGRKAYDLLNDSMEAGNLTAGVDSETGKSTFDQNLGVVTSGSGDNNFEKEDHSWYRLGEDNIGSDTVVESSLGEQVDLTGTAPQRRQGGPVASGLPYIVGDELGMDTAEMFVPNQSGQIVSNKDLKDQINDATDLINAEEVNNHIAGTNEQLGQLIEENNMLIGENRTLIDNNKALANNNAQLPVLSNKQIEQLTEQHAKLIDENMQLAESSTNQRKLVDIINQLTDENKTLAGENNKFAEVSESISKQGQLFGLLEKFTQDNKVIADSLLNDQTYLDQMLEGMSNDNKTLTDNMSNNQSVFDQLLELVSNDNKTLTDNMFNNQAALDQLAERISGDSKAFSDMLTANKGLFDQIAEHMDIAQGKLTDNASTNQNVIDQIAEHMDIAQGKLTDNASTNQNVIDQLAERISGDQVSFSDILTANKSLFDQISEHMDTAQEQLTDNASTNQSVLDQLAEQFNIDRNIVDEKEIPTESPKTDTELTTVVEDNTQTPEVAPTDTQMSTKLQDIQSDLTKLPNPVIMNNSQDLSELINAKKSTIETVKVLQDIVKRYNINEQSKINTRMTNSR